MKSLIKLTVFSLCLSMTFFTNAQTKPIKVLPDMRPLKAGKVAVSPDGKTMYLLLANRQAYKTEMVNDSVCKEPQPLDLNLNKNTEKYVIGSLFFSYDGKKLYYNLLPRDIKEKIIIMKYDLTSHTSQTIAEGYSMTSVFNQDLFLMSEEGERVEKIDENNLSQLSTIIDYPMPERTYAASYILPDGKTLVLGLWGNSSYHPISKELQGYLNQFYISKLVDDKWTKPTLLKEINLKNHHHYNCSITLDYKIYFVAEKVDQKYTSSSLLPKERYVYVGYLPKKYISE